LPPMKRQVQINPGLSSQLDEKRGSRHEPNRGLTFNRCLAISSVDTVDQVYLISKGGVFRFKKSSAEQVCR
jgi:hypothetical protein